MLFNIRFVLIIKGKQAFTHINTPYYDYGEIYLFIFFRRLTIKQKGTYQHETCFSKRNLIKWNQYRIKGNPLQNNNEHIRMHPHRCLFQ